MAQLRRTLWLLAACIVACSCQQNIDTQQPIVRFAPTALNGEGYFGYSVVLHKKQVVGGFSQNLQNTYLIVGAPNGTRTNSIVKNTGFVYECPITEGGECTRIAALSDDSANGNAENKEGQFMGGAIASNGDKLIACGHRYVNFNPSNTNTRNVFGRCFYADRSLNNFVEYQPCEGIGRRVTSSVGVCQAGMSASVAETSDGVDHIVVGAPGTYTWSGILIRDSPPRFQPYDLTVDNLFGWQGYSITKGRFQSENVEDFATSVPRLGSYFGAVHIIENNNDLQMVSQNLVGEQMGEYYGFALAALNMVGNGLHELLVSAPMYRDLNIGPDTGRVYVYQNNGGTLSEVTKLVGMKAYSRFGHAMASLGDISGDGFDDVAISAPFADEGKVYIYHSSASQVITPTPQQIISPDILNLMSSTIASFGTSLFSGVDVDDNSYNDLAVGSYIDQTVVLLRTRPLAQISTILRATPGIVNLGITGTRRTYSFDGMDYFFFEVQLCVEYSGEGLGDTLDLNLQLNAETTRQNQGLQQRLFFGSLSNKPSSIMEPIVASRGVEQCSDYTVFINEGIADILNGFIIDLQVTTTPFSLPATDGDVDPVDFSAYPVVDIVGPSSLQVEILNDCEGQCIADLAVVVNGNIRYLDSTSMELDVLTVGRVREVVIPLTINNNGNSAFLAQLVFSLPIQQLQFQGVNDSVTTCNPGNGNGQEIPYVCDLGNPFRQAAVRNVEFRFAPSDTLTGAEGNIPMTFNVTSLNEDDTRVADNRVTVTLTVDTQANIFVDQGIVNPDQVNHAPIRPEGEIKDVTQLGPNFVTTFTVGNEGPSIIPTSQLTIYWPLREKSSSYYYLYPIGWRAIQSTSVSVSCVNTYFNPESYEIAAAEDITENTAGISDGRRRRSVQPLKPRRHRRNVLLPRQETMEDVPVSVERTVSCEPGDRGNDYECVTIVCSVNQLSAGNRVQIEISANIDERQIGGVDSYIFIPFAEVETTNAGHITEGDLNDNTASAQFRSTPAVLVIGGDNSSDETVPWYAIAIPIIAAVILFIVAGVVLYFCGFFRRKNKSQIEEQARDNIAEDSGTAM